MANTYKWKIASLSANPSAEGQSNVVYLASWVVIGTDGENTTSISGNQTLEYAAGSPFIAFESLCYRNKKHNIICN